MDCIDILMLRLLSEAVEEDFNVALDYSAEEKSIMISKGDIVWFEVHCMPYYEEWEEKAIEVINYEEDRYYHYLDLETAYALLKEFIVNLYINDYEVEE